MTIKITPRQPMQIDLWLSADINLCLIHQDLKRLGALEINTGQQKTRFEDHFCCDQEEDGALMVQWEGDFPLVHGIGAGIDQGVVIVDGDAGSAVGEYMSGGEIRVNGSAGHHLGRSMSGGRIQVSGNTGDHVGGPGANAIQGMTGGEIFIFGNAGHYLGERMRRGTVVVEGTSGDYPGFEMLAGTIIMNQGCGIGPGVGMKRGTLISHQDMELNLCPHFEFASQYEPTFIKSLYRWLSDNGFPQYEGLMTSVVQRYCGDMASGGRGELLICLPQ